MKQISQISKRILIDSLKIKIRKRKCANKKLQISLKSVRINQTWASPVNVTVSSLNSSTAKNGIYLHSKMERFEKKKRSFSPRFQAKSTNTWFSYFNIPTSHFSLKFPRVFKVSSLFLHSTGIILSSLVPQGQGVAPFRTRHRWQR